MENVETAWENFMTNNIENDYDVIECNNYYKDKQVNDICRN